jgi:hypothetical protein
MVVGSSSSWQFSFRREGQKRTRHQSGTSPSDFLDLSGYSVGIQSKIDWAKLTEANLTSQNEALRPEKTLSWERIA